MVIEEAKREDDKKYVEIQDSLRREIQQLRDKVSSYALQIITLIVDVAKGSALD